MLIIRKRKIFRKRIFTRKQIFCHQLLENKKKSHQNFLILRILKVLQLILAII